MKPDQIDAPNSNEPDDDDAPIGRVLSRREVLALFGVTGALFLGGRAVRRTPASAPESSLNPALTKQYFLPMIHSNSSFGTATPTAAPTATVTLTPTPTPNSVACVISPALTEGPFFIDENLNRSDIRANTATATVNPGVARSGTPLNLGIRVSRISNSGCTLLPNAQVDVWHCDANGEYSDINNQLGINTPGQNWLRGCQLADGSGMVNFITIYPGWYTSRAVHIHLKIRATVSSISYVFNSQLFFYDALSTAVYAGNPSVYTHAGTRKQNSADDIYTQSSGKTLLSPVISGNGYSAFIDLGMSIV